MTALIDYIAAEIREEGAIGIERFMTLALTHPEYGYYMTRDPLGEAGDFITAPEISQMFGELIGLWMAANWSYMDSPDHVVIAELGPGRGTLMQDAMRAAAAVPAFIEAAALHLIEISPVLKSRQQSILDAVWHDSFDDVPDGPMFLIANEYFDALPVRQFVRQEEGWFERLVGLSESGALEFQRSEERADGRIPQTLRDAPPGAVFEQSEPARTLAGKIGKRAAAQPTYALIIDYGHVERTIGETLQAVHNHEYGAILDEPGDADLTAHVDFSALVQAARENGAETFGPITQAEFLKRLGIGARAEQLRANATIEERASIESALARLTGRQQMGALFKALAIASPDLSVPEGF